MAGQHKAALAGYVEGGFEGVAEEFHRNFEERGPAPTPRPYRRRRWLGQARTQGPGLPTAARASKARPTLQSRSWSCRVVTTYEMVTAGSDLDA